MTPEEAQKVQDARLAAGWDWCPDDMHDSLEEDMADTIAAQTWEYALESEWSDGKWTTTTGWFPAPDRARADLVLDGMPTRLVRRPVGPVEVVE